MDNNIANLPYPPKDYTLLNKQFDFPIYAYTYTPVYRYTMLKSLWCSINLILSNDKYQHDTCKTFDKEWYNQKIDDLFAKITNFYLKYKLEIIIPTIYRINLENFGTPSSLSDINTYDKDNTPFIHSTIYMAYRIILNIIRTKLNAIKPDDLPKYYYHQIYLPIEEECTLGYFIHKYIEPIDFSDPLAMGTSNDTKHKIDELTTNDKEQYERLIHAYTIYSRKQKILSYLGIEFSEEKLSDYSLKIVHLLQELDTGYQFPISQAFRVQKLLQSPSSETMPYLGKGMHSYNIALLMGEIYKEFSLQRIYQLTDSIAESFFQIFESEEKLIKKYEELQNRNTETLRYNILIQQVGTILIQLHNNQETYKAIPLPTCKNELESFLYLMLKNKITSLLQQRITVYRYICNNRHAFKIISRDTYNACGHEPIFINSITISNQLHANAVIKDVCSKLNISQDQFHKYYQIIVSTYNKLWGKVYYIYLYEFIAALQLVHRIYNNEDNDCNYSKFKYSYFYQKSDKELYFKEYMTSTQTKAALKALLKHDTFNPEESFLLVKLLDTQKLLCGNDHIFNLYEQLIELYEKLFELYNSNEAPEVVLRKGNYITNIWAHECYNLRP